MKTYANSIIDIEIVFYELELNGITQDVSHSFNTIVNEMKTRSKQVRRPEYKLFKVFNGFKTDISQAIFAK